MKTQLSLINLLKTQEKDIYIFNLDENGELTFKNSPYQFIAYRSVNFCSDVVEVVENEAHLICAINQVLTQIDTRHICDIFTHELPIEVVYLETDENGDYYKFLHKFEFDKAYNKFSFKFLTGNYFFIKTTDWDKHLAKKWSKK